MIEFSSRETSTTVSESIGSRKDREISEARILDEGKTVSGTKISVLRHRKHR